MVLTTRPGLSQHPPHPPTSQHRAAASIRFREDAPTVHRGRRGGPWTLPACRRPVPAPPALSAPAPFQPASGPLLRSTPRSASHFKWVHLDLMPKPLEDPCFRRPGGLWPGGTSRREPAMREQIEVALALTSVGQKQRGRVTRRLVCCTNEGLGCDTRKPRLPPLHTCKTAPV